LILSLKQKCWQIAGKENIIRLDRIVHWDVSLLGRRLTSQYSRKNWYNIWGKSDNFNEIIKKVVCMKILTAILSYSQTSDLLKACLDTWIKNIQPPHDYVIYGDERQSNTYDKCWNCSPEEGERRHRLPIKTLNMLKKALNEDWDFLFKCDDDTYVNFPKLVEYLKDFDKHDVLYIGGPIFNPFPYAQGGAGYVLTRSAIIKSMDRLQEVCHNPETNKRAEDYSIGFALKESGILLIDSPLLLSPSPHNARKDQSICFNQIKSGNITSHYLRPETMRKIYDLI